jgi:hypothetical protein
MRVAAQHPDGPALNVQIAGAGEPRSLLTRQGEIAVVSGAMLQIDWPSPAPIRIGTRLSAGQLDTRATFKGERLQRNEVVLC